MIKTIGPQELNNLSEEEQSVLVDVSHQAEIWTRRLAPRFLGPVSLYSDYKARTVENGYQYTKVFEHHTGKLGLPTKEYLIWAEKGWKRLKCDEDLINKEPLYYYWYGQKLDKFEAREYILIPLYTHAVMREGSFFERLKRFYYKHDKCIVLYDEHGYNRDNLSYKEIINNDKPFSHVFILANLLETTI